MGNYSDFETDFIERTLALIDQYNNMIEGKPFPEQYNYTLTLNCLLGLIVMPRERAVSYLPSDRLTPELKAEIGLNESQLPGEEMNLRELIHKMRNSVAHFCVQVESISDARLVDQRDAWCWPGLCNFQCPGASPISKILRGFVDRQYETPSGCPHD